MSSIIYNPNILSKALITINNMNANANTVNEQYAWVDAELENCALQEQQDYEDQNQCEAMDIDEANPEWNEEEDEEEDDYMEYCEHCNAGFDTDRQLGYHQMVCLPPGNNDLCVDFLGCPPPLTRQNCHPLIRMDEDEELIADGNMESDEDEDEDEDLELEDLVLYNIKRYNELTFAPLKKQKTFHEHPIPEPMDICESETETKEKWMYSCCAGCVLTDGESPLQYCRRAYPDRVYSDDSDEEREIDEYDPHREFKRSNTVDDENEMEIWILEQEAKRRYPKRRTPQMLEEVSVRLFESEAEEPEFIMPILDEEDIPPMPVLQRQNTQFTVNGVTVFNGNPNGSRFFDIDEML
jgi:hypothetical protein